MNTKTLTLLVTGLTVLTNIALFWVGAPQTVSCSIAKTMGASAVLAFDK